MRWYARRVAQYDSLFIAVIPCLLSAACSPPEITDYDRDKYQRLCRQGPGTRDEKEEKRVMKGLDGDAKARIVGVCAQGSGADRYYKVATTTTRGETKERESICDAMRAKIKQANITVYCSSLNCSTECGK
jgi:hypothetical protein